MPEVTASIQRLTASSGRPPGSDPSTTSSTDDTEPSPSPPFATYHGTSGVASEPDAPPVPSRNGMRTAIPLSSSGTRYMAVSSTTSRWGRAAGSMEYSCPSSAP
ncbi:hypothetical protein GCM10010151_33220 [Actinoallomurus spadix]|uniref:Uncharacterized protein n=1 Tax=Actinoallomurus spadix TaxID=79912 RepID=A0ABN0WL68_9ACTN